MSLSVAAVVDGILYEFDDLQGRLDAGMFCGEIDSADAMRGSDTGAKIVTNQMKDLRDPVSATFHNQPFAGSVGSAESLACTNPLMSRWHPCRC